MTEYDIDLMTWYSQRQLPFKPKHFILVKTPVTKESELWINNRLSGRFCIAAMHGQDNFVDIQYFPAFENPQEAILYELTWS